MCVSKVEVVKREYCNIGATCRVLFYVSWFACVCDRSPPRASHCDFTRLCVHASLERWEKISACLLGIGYSSSCFGFRPERRAIVLDHVCIQELSDEAVCSF